MKASGFLLVALLYAFGAATAHADADIAAGKAKAEDKCDNCHGGGKDKDGDDLAGMDKDKFIQAMNEYRSKQRKNGGMRRRASEITEQDIENLAAYYSAKAKQ